MGLLPTLSGHFYGQATVGTSNFASVKWQPWQPANRLQGCEEQQKLSQGLGIHVTHEAVWLLIPHMAPGWLFLAA